MPGRGAPRREPDDTARPYSRHRSSRSLPAWPSARARRMPPAPRPQNRSPLRSEEGRAGSFAPEKLTEGLKNAARKRGRFLPHVLQLLRELRLGAAVNLARYRRHLVVWQGDVVRGGGGVATRRGEVIRERTNRDPSLRHRRLELTGGIPLGRL